MFCFALLLGPVVSRDHVCFSPSPPSLFSLGSLINDGFTLHAIVIEH